MTPKLPTLPDVCLGSLDRSRAIDAATAAIDLNLIEARDALKNLDFEALWTLDLQMQVFAAMVHAKVQQHIQATAAAYLTPDAVLAGLPGQERDVMEVKPVPAGVDRRMADQGRADVMGMYTELHLNVELKRDVPESVLAVLQFMVRAGVNEEEHTPDLPDHPLFKTDRWDYMLRCDSYYFPADTNSTLRLDDVSKTWYLCVRCNLKNYDDEIAKFLDWVLPYADANTECLGYYRYEEDDDPTLIYGPARTAGAS